MLIELLSVLAPSVLRAAHDATGASTLAPTTAISSRQDVDERPDDQVSAVPS
ncbi:MAG: hypothetical protein R3F34_11680 [Planctomycetota bacterium]